MANFTVGFEIRELFVDTRKIETHVNREGIKTLGRRGGLIRRIARNSLKRRKSSAMPGQPPSVHAESKVGQTKVTVRTKTGRTKIQKTGGKRNQITLKNIQYGVDQSSLSMVCGPIGLNQRKVGGFTVPELMEKGGSVPRREVLIGDQWRAPTRQQARQIRNGKAVTLKTRTRTLQYAPHPFMVPARDKAMESLPGLWT